MDQRTESQKVIDLAAAERLKAEITAEAKARKAESDLALGQAIANHARLKPENQGWQANPDGLSGRMVRGYKHWRSKR